MIRVVSIRTLFHHIKLNTIQSKTSKENDTLIIRVEGETSLSKYGFCRHISGENGGHVVSGIGTAVWNMWVEEYNLS